MAGWDRRRIRPRAEAEWRRTAARGSSGLVALLGWDARGCPAGPPRDARGVEAARARQSGRIDADSSRRAGSAQPGTGCGPGQGARPREAALAAAQSTGRCTAALAAPQSREAGPAAHTGHRPARLCLSSLTRGDWACG